ncbi:hypothetical protein BCY88_35280 [Paraburkholderia fungorum]|uniref:Uncharacterized protein n=1 Tax=Paraburkholderia fungorum TaxID=134537 RepID=A0A3R7I6Y3_9BURK|nr:hypothetical protein BCY88_35280 [Paraburkholderia fungorum]
MNTLCELLPLIVFCGELDVLIYEQVPMMSVEDTSSWSAWAKRWMASRIAAGLNLLSICSNLSRY